MTFKPREKGGKIPSQELSPETQAGRSLYFFASISIFHPIFRASLKDLPSLLFPPFSSTEKWKSKAITYLKWVIILARREWGKNHHELHSSRKSDYYVRLQRKAGPISLPCQTKWRQMSPNPSCNDLYVVTVVISFCLFVCFLVFLIFLLLWSFLDGFSGLLVVSNFLKSSLWKLVSDGLCHGGSFLFSCGTCASVDPILRGKVFYPQKFCRVLGQCSLYQRFGLSQGNLAKRLFRTWTCEIYRL